VIERTLRVENKLGLHARASAKLAQVLSAFAANAHLTFRGREINAKSILGLMTLAAAQGAELLIRLEGKDEEKAWTAVSDLFARKFDEGE
jgi:phosphocarrier protein HPr